MRQVSSIALLSVLTLLLGGCQIGNSDEDVTVESVDPSPTASQAPIAAAPTATATDPFENPVTPERPENPGAVPGLLQTLPPEAVAKQADKGRSDPFAAVPVQAVVTVSPDASRGSGNTTRPVPVLPQGPKPQQNNTGGGARNNKTSSSSRRTSPKSPTSGKKVSGANTPGASSSPRAGGANTPGASSSPRAGGANTPGASSSPRAGGANTPGASGTTTPGGIAIAPFSPDLPILPEPDQAKAIEVTGVIQVDGVANAIVKVPNEPARYVKPGQRLSNGQVLVKRIEMNGAPVPIVILEQYGVEVARRVGDKPIGDPGQGTPTAVVPAQKSYGNSSPT
ncbi:MAG: hypothetical protein WA919_24485 [Coleofasciculaceae cyanobacterium]